MTVARADLPALTGIRFVAAVFVFNARVRPPAKARRFSTASLSPATTG